MTAAEFQAMRGDPEWMPCSACRAPVFMARCMKKDGTIGKLAPLLRPKEGGPKPNIVAWQGADGWLYRIVQEGGEFLNHFVDCPAAAQFRKKDQR